MRTPDCSRVGCQTGPGWRSNNAILSVLHDSSRAATLRLAGPAPMPTAW